MRIEILDSPNKLFNTPTLIQMARREGFEPPASRMRTERSLNRAVSPYFTIFRNFLSTLIFLLVL